MLNPNHVKAQSELWGAQSFIYNSTFYDFYLPLNLSICISIILSLFYTIVSFVCCVHIQNIYQDSYSSIHPLIYVYMRLSIFIFIHLFIYLTVHSFIFVSMHLFNYVSIFYLFIYSFCFFSVSMHLFINKFIHLFIYSSINSFIYVSIHPIYSSFYLFVYLSFLLYSISLLNYNLFICFSFYFSSC